MKKLLSILLTLCLLIAVTVIPVPAMAATGQILFDYGIYGVTDMPISHTIGEAIDYPELPAYSNGVLAWSLYSDVYEEPPVILEDEYLQVYVVLLKGIFNFENYNPTRNIKWSGRVQPLAEPGNEENTVIQFNNNGIPYQSEAVAKDAAYSNAYVKSGSTYTAFKDTPLGAAAVEGITDETAQKNALKAAFEADIAGDGYKKYYNATAQHNNLNSATTNFQKMDAYNAIELDKLDAATTYRITINYKRISLGSNLYIMPVTWSKDASKRATMTSYNDARITIRSGTDSDYVTVSTVITTPDNFVTSGSNIGDMLRLVLYTGKQDANNVVYFDDITVEKLVGTVTYVIPEGATVNGKNGSVTVGYAANETITFPEVVYAEGCGFVAWTDANGNPVNAPTLGGTYTLVVNEPAEMVTVTLNRGTREPEVVPVEKGTEYTLPDTKFTETAWWSAENGDTTNEFVGYEGDKVTVTKNVTYYTSEVFAAGSAATFRNWTGINSTGEDSYLYKSVTAENDTGTWVMNGGSRVCSRIGIVEDNTTYRIDITFKATTSTDLGFRFIEHVANNSTGTGCSYWENGKDFYTVKADTNLTEWKTVTLYYTTDLGATITASENGLDDTKSGLKNTVYLAINKAKTGADVEFALKEVTMTAIDSAVTTKGASVLKDEKVVNGKQAIRYYFDYATTDGTDIIIDGKSYDVVDRGFVYINGDVSHYTNNGNYSSTGKLKVCYTKSTQASGKGLLKSETVSGEDLKTCWAFDEEDGVMTYSTYIENISEAIYDAKFMVRGFVRFTDDEGTIHIVYSKTVNRSVQGILDALASGNAGNNGVH